MEKKVKPIIKMGFTNINGETFKNVREIAYKNNEIYGNLGRLVAETKHEVNNGLCIHDDDEGVYIFQNLENPNIAYRIYKRFAEYGFNGDKDDKLIQKLQERKDKVKLAKFPTGVITKDGRIIGQEIPYFMGCITIDELSKCKAPIKNPIKLYREVLLIIKEMYDNGILYLDNHAKNFMINSNNEVEVIDYESNYVRFDDFSSGKTERIFSNYNSMINSLNSNFELDYVLGNILQTNNFEDSFEQLENMEKKLNLK